MIISKKTVRVTLIGFVVFVITHMAIAETKSNPFPEKPTPEKSEVLQPSDQVNGTSLFDLWDTDRNDALSQQEFELGWEELLLQGRLNKQFNVIDSNQDSVIDANEYKELLLIKDAGDAAPVLSEFDRDNNGKLEFSEYLLLVKEMIKRNEAEISPKNKSKTRSTKKDK